MAETIPFRPQPDGPDAEARALCCEALALSRRAEAAGHARVAAALDHAALEAARAFGLFAPYGLPPAGDRDDVVPDEPEALMAWALRNIQGGGET